MPLCWTDDAATQCQPDLPSQGHRCTGCVHPSQPHLYQRYQVRYRFQAQMALLQSSIEYLTLGRYVCAYQLGQRLEGTVSALYAGATGTGD
jgi:hypothetical protein